MILSINFHTNEQIVFDARNFIYLCVQQRILKWISSGVRLSGLNIKFLNTYFFFLFSVMEEYEN